MPSISRSALRLAAVALGAGFLLIGAPALSQPPPTPALFSLSVSPAVPYAGDRVTVSVGQENFTVASTTFAWFRNGVPIDAASGLGKSTLTLITDSTKQEVILIRVVANPGAEFSVGEQSAYVATLPNPINQQQLIAGIRSNFTLEASAVSPNPGESVNIRVVTFAFDRDRATYQWYVNGALDRSASGRGQTRLALAAGKEGETKTVRVDVTTPTGETNSKSITIRTMSAPLYWWAETQVPYWYKGKALPSVGSRIGVVALPNVPGPQELSYQWVFNGAPLPPSSGVGRSALSLTLAFPVEERVEVTMKDLEASWTKTASVRVKPISPSVGLYEVRPLRGLVFERELREFNAPSGEPYEFLAAPFFFPRERERRLAYRWTLDGKEITGAFDTPWRFTLESKPSEPAAGRLSVRVEDTAKPAVSAHSNLDIQLR